MRDRALWIGCAAYAALFVSLGWIKYAAHRNLVDFGIFAQTAASAFECFCNPIEGSHWAFHFSPILYAVGAAMTLVRSPMTLVALSAVAGALVAPPVYAIVLRMRGDVGAARLAALVAWLYPPLAGLVFADFHENGFAPAAVAWTLYAFDAGFLGWAVVGAVVTLSIKEDQAVFVAIAGALGAWRYRGTKAGRVAAAVALASVLLLVWFFAYVQPHAAAGNHLTWAPERFYAWRAQEAVSLASGVAARCGFLLLALVPLLFLPLRSRLFWLAVAPLAEVLLSRMPATFTMGTHYAGAWIGYVLVAFADSVGRLEGRGVRVALGACAVLAACELAVADPLHPRMNLRAVQPRDVALDRFLTTLPRGASVATQEEAYTHLALFDPNARLLPETADVPIRACFVLLDSDFPDSARLREYGDAVRKLSHEGQYIRAARDGGITLYRRSGRCR